MEVIKSQKKLCMCCMEEHDVQTVRVQEHIEFKSVRVDYMAEYEYCSNADNLSYKNRGVSMTGLVYAVLPMGAVPIANKSLIDLKGVCYEEDEFPDGSDYHFLRTNNEGYASLTQEDREILNKVIQVCGKDTKEQIVRRMHKERAYRIDFSFASWS